MQSFLFKNMITIGFSLLIITGCDNQFLLRDRKSPSIPSQDIKTIGYLNKYYDYYVKKEQSVSLLTEITYIDKINHQWIFVKDKESEYPILIELSEIVNKSGLRSGEHIYISGRVIPDKSLLNDYHIIAEKITKK